MSRDLPERLADVPCPVCGAQAPAALRPLRDHFSAATFTVGRCTECDTVYVTDPPTRETIGSYYAAEAGDAMHRPPGRLFQRAREVRIRSDLRPLLERLGASDGVADVGSGDGSVARHLRGQGRPVVAVDIYPEAEWPHTDIPYRQLDLATGALAPGALRGSGAPVRGAVLRHVLEHVHEPVSTLRALAEAGVEHVLVVVPNADSRAARRLGADWYYWDPPRHLTSFTAATLGRAAREAGLALSWSRTYGIDELVTSAYRALLTRGRRGPGVRALRPTGLLAGGATVLQTPVSDGVLQAVLSRPAGAGAPG